MIDMRWRVPVALLIATITEFPVYLLMEPGTTAKKAVAFSVWVAASVYVVWLYRRPDVRTIKGVALHWLCAVALLGMFNYTMYRLGHLPRYNETPVAITMSVGGVVAMVYFAVLVAVGRLSLLVKP